MGYFVGLLMTKGLSERMARFVAMAGLVLAILAAVGVGKCVYDGAHKAQARVDRGQAEAGSDTGSIAIDTLETVTANSAATDRTVDDASAAVRAAPEAQKGAVAVNQACRFKANRNKPQCQGANK